MVYFAREGRVPMIDVLPVFQTVARQDEGQSVLMTDCHTGFRPATPVALVTSQNARPRSVGAKKKAEVLINRLPKTEADR